MFYNKAIIIGLIHAKPRMRRQDRIMSGGGYAKPNYLIKMRVSKRSIAGVWNQPMSGRVEVKKLTFVSSRSILMKKGTRVFTATSCRDSYHCENDNERDIFFFE